MSPKTDRAKIEALAEKYIKKGRLQDAITEYRKLLEGNAQDIAVRNILGDLYIKADDKKKAVEEFSRIAEFYEDKGLYSKAIAIYKRIKRLDPKDIDSSQKLATLYRDQGFSSEAKSEYLSLAQRLAGLMRTKDAISMYENLLKLDKNDTESRLKLADLYTSEKLIEKALDEYNRVAEFKMRNGQLEEAGDILVRAKELKEDHSRTITNLIELFKRENKKKKALDLVEEILEKDKDNLRALYILGNLHFEDKSLKEAEKIFARIISIRPKEVEARVKLGRICIHKNDLDQAFEYFEPLADTLLRKEKYDKAIGLLGLTLASKKAHLPTLTKLASIYKAQDQKKSFELVSMVLLEEYRKNNLREKMLAVFNELLHTFPENEEYKYEFMQLKKAMGILEEDSGDAVTSVQLDEAQSTIDATLAQAELYVEQGLIRNAKRILENLRSKFPEDSRILERIEKLKMIPTGVKAGEISTRVEKVTRKETQIFGKIADKEKEGDSHLYGDDVGEERVTSADIFAETDIVPIITKEVDEKRYYDLTDVIDKELTVIKATLSYQIRGDTTVVEKALSDIVADFRKALEDKVDKDDYESHYNLGIAFLEQGLFDEAIEECKVAARDKTLEVECYSVISFCYKQKKDYKEAVTWLEKAQGVSEKDSDQAYALKYELGALFEDMDEKDKAAKIYKEVLTWNPDYRDVSEKVTALKGNS
ncbi:MAG: tetratricopeptide repeat protein [Candidatus Aminicenantes bacterium]|nr:tetratricopeptide repeat protein [Candidatus Aminicenantes bacterium]